MEIGTRQSKSRRKARTIQGSAGPLDELYPHSLQFYTVPPTENISLQEFEDYAVERLKVLKSMETVSLRQVKGSSDYEEALTKELKSLNRQGIMKGLYKKSDEPMEELKERRKDHISHFILRLAYCKTEELRRWFLAQEMDLFRFRFSQESKESIEEFLNIYNLDYKPIPEDEKNNIMSQLSASAFKVSTSMVQSINYYKVPFTEALDLVRMRKVYLSHGYAYVPQSDLVHIILTAFRTQLSHALAVTCRALPQLEEDGRLLPMLGTLSKRYLGQDYNSKKPPAGQITADMLDMLSKKSYPLCMSHTHQSLRQHHHLKHWGRMQYGLFLKAIGLSLSEALRFWRGEFTKLMDPDKFDKQYSYNIRHNYGKEGKRADYTPYSCIKIITSNPPGPGDYHGCPFRHTDADLLKQRLQAQGVPKDKVTQILDHIRTGGHYQLACGLYFEHIHGVQMNPPPMHPNHYFEESQKALNGDKKPADGAVTGSQTPSGVRIVKSSQSASAPSQGAADSSHVADQTAEVEFEDMELDMVMQEMEDCSGEQTSLPDTSAADTSSKSQVNA